MFKKIIISVVAVILVLPLIVYASDTTSARIGNKYYDNLVDAINNASSTDVIKLLTNVEVHNSLEINKTVNIDLNGNTISAPSAVFQVQGGSLTLTGKGTIKELEPNYGAIKVIGSNSYTDEKYSLVNVEKDVTLEGWSGIFISQDNSKSYGVHIYMDGKINAVSDTTGSEGVGIYVNGNIQDKSGSPIINILDNAKIVSNGTGLYIAGYTSLYINNAYISGKQSGIAIKSGIINIDGATVLCDGEDSTPTEGYNNGINASGTAIQIESNTGYKGDIELIIKSGNFISENSNVIYEYIGKGKSTLVKNINIMGGTFTTKSSKEVFSFSNSFKEKHNAFITGGSYSTNPSSYLNSDYNSILKDNKYIVNEKIVKNVFSEINNNPKNIVIKLIIVITVIITSLVFAYLNRNTILRRK